MNQSAARHEMKCGRPQSGARNVGGAPAVVQQPCQFGYEPITLINKYLNGDKFGCAADKKVLVPTLAITKDKVEGFAAKVKHCAATKSYVHFEECSGGTLSRPRGRLR
jgi:hypothetical protein